MHCDEYMSAYEKILEGYLRTGQEVFLLQSYDLGKKMIQNDLSTEFVADMHFRLLERIKKKNISEEFRDRGYNLNLPFLELIMAFGLVFHDQSGALLRFAEIVEAGKKERKKRKNDKKSFQQKIRNEIVLAEECERRRIAHYLHDNMGHALTIVKMKIQEIHSNLTSDSGESLIDIKEIAQMIDRMIGQTRTLTFDLYPPILDDLGLIPTIEWYAESFASKTGLKINVIKTGKPGTLSSLASVYLFRAVKEILNNILKHAGAQEVMLVIHGAKSRLRIVVDDDGMGFDINSVRKMPVGTAGIGFVNIRQWVFDMDGAFFVESTPGHGTRVVIEAPVKGTGYDH
ncbi:MAG: hypothetical protein JRD93_15790 [Deltaproteobacteria bacterium]|nr:hypothetical protein [Deltaproteobacteria bacterium]MBW2663400.1 hypothetical protein [Deltaproteobacteria bacterium]